MIKLNTAVIFLILFVCATVAQERQLTEVDLTVNGIRSGSSHRVVQHLGKPLKIKKLGFDECAGRYRRVLYFKGLEVGVMGSKDGRRFSVLSLNVTGRNWLIRPNIRIGASKKALLAAFGRPVSETEGELYYVTKENLGGVSFHLVSGRLARVEMMETLC